MDRKSLDLKLLADMVEEEPDNPRHLYYIAQTYNLLQKYDLAFEYFMKRVNHPQEGFLQEKVDAYFEAARIANFKIGKPWPECEALYMNAYMLDRSRPDSIYFIGIHHYLDGNKKKAFEYFKVAYEIGYPVHAQYSLKPTLSYHFLLKYLAELCYMFGDYKTGESASLLFLEKNKPTDEYYPVMISWYKIFLHLNRMPAADLSKPVIKSKKPLLCFVADGGFEPWSGRDILTKGVGGSETYIIELARYIQQHGYFDVMVFCNCPKPDVFEGVQYRHLREFHSFVVTHSIHTCIISRYSEYVPVAINGNVDKVYLVLHDLMPSGNIIPLHPKINKIFCLTEWHVEHFLDTFGHFRNKTVPFYYGIDFSNFAIEDSGETTNAAVGETTNAAVGETTNAAVGETTNGRPDNLPDVMDGTPAPAGKIPNKFIYSSFPNRGLLYLLKMWPKIIERVPTATLHIHSDVDGKWANETVPEHMALVKKALKELRYDPKMGIHYHGWTSKKALADSWKTAEYWLYPCVFAETFCLTALEAALTKTLVIAPDLAALNNTIDDRGLLIPGAAETGEWQADALAALFKIMDNKEKKAALIQKNYEWASKLSWKARAQDLLDRYLLPKRDTSAASNLPAPTATTSAGDSNTESKQDYDPLAVIEYSGMYNWTNDLPPGTDSKATFESVLSLLADKTGGRPSKLMEIGTYTGVSIINILSRIRGSSAVVIDTWQSYDENQLLTELERNGIEEVFRRNVEVAGMQDRIKAIKGDSGRVLLDLIAQGESGSYDFIYVDGSHLCLDCYADLVSSWRLLAPGGILAIDDYSYQMAKTLESPYEACNRFLEKYKGEYEVINIGYRIFIEKK